ncbi:FAD-binding oxidoreductase [Mangrovicoccus algicola]|uniref:FAD-binding oxidoreductase n=1 Tax=Mangrovicoccus algicola TaxID=2771008 RepID=A0A8J6YTJ6_9RHOB|nr:FAD-binding oxidoreductase [Mangrovicoccus algicola]MBE3637252.1 FAD-binding oxidoreductase [Mangrovicoccus algicola]
MRILEEAAGRLTGRFGPSVVVTGAEARPYAGDMMYRATQAAVCVFRPDSTRMLSDGLKALADLDLDFVPRGGGSGLAGGATPDGTRASIIVSTERMRAIRRIDPRGRLMVAEAGVVLAEAQQAALEAGLQLGLTHGGAGSASLGGSISTNAGGANVLRYGMARDQLLGLEAVLPCGTVIGQASELWKDNTGYNLAQLIAGAEGTLAFVTAVTLKLRAGAKDRQAALFAVSSPAAALDLLALSHETLGEAICAAELMSGDAVDFAARMDCAGSPLEDRHDWLLLIEAEATSRFFDLAGGFEALLEEAFEQELVHDGVLAQSEAQRLGLWHLREGVAEAMDLHRGPILRTDCSVPVEAVPKFVAGVAEGTAAKAPEAFAAFFGHLGDGNIHVNFLPRPDIAPAGLPGALSLMVEDVARGLSGSVSAEHGIGLHKRDALARMKPAAELSLMARIKAAFDPGGRLNPGKIFSAPTGAADKEGSE